MFSGLLRYHLLSQLSPQGQDTSLPAPTPRVRLTPVWQNLPRFPRTKTRPHSRGRVRYWLGAGSTRLAKRPSNAPALHRLHGIGAYSACSRIALPLFSTFRRLLPISFLLRVLFEQFEARPIHPRGWRNLAPLGCLLRVSESLAVSPCQACRLPGRAQRPRLGPAGQANPRPTVSPTAPSALSTTKSPARARPRLSSAQCRCPGSPPPG
jgi:hypothetical protein